MALTAAQLAAREGKITASFAPQLMAGDLPAIHNKWLELIGDPSWQPEDMTNNWPVYHGTVMEPHVIDWHERLTGVPLTRRGEVVVHPHRPNVCATLDCYRAFDQCVIDAKCPGAWMKLDDILAYYQPQLIVQRGCVECINASLLISHGGAAPHEYAITIDPDYEAKVWQRVDQFWRCVEMMIPPVETMALQPLTAPEEWRTVDLSRDGEINLHNWAPEMVLQLVTWNETRDNAVAHEFAREQIKALLPENVGVLRGAGLIVKRNRARAVSIKRDE
jgi:hypothetical protein